MRLQGDNSKKRGAVIPVRGSGRNAQERQLAGLVHPVGDVVPEAGTMARHLSQRPAAPTTLRTQAEAMRSFDGMVRL